MEGVGGGGGGEEEGLGPILLPPLLLHMII